MRDIIYLLFHLLTTPAKLIRPGGSRTVIAENLLLKQQLKKRKYQMLFSPGGGRRPGPKGPSTEVIPDTAGQALNAIGLIWKTNSVIISATTMNAGLILVAMAVLR